jgi:O-antigen ligase
MRKVTEYLLWAYAFSVPWDFATVPVIGTVARFLGVLAVGATVLTILSEGRFRKPDAIVLSATAFVVLAMLSAIWTASTPATYQAARTYAQLLGSLWVVREIVRTREQYLSVVRAFCVGIFVPLSSLLINYAQGVSSVAAKSQYTADGVNADAMGLLVVLALPLAWQMLLAARSTAARAIPLVLLAMTPIAVLLTAVRGAFLAGLVAALVVPLTMKMSVKAAIRGLVVAVVVGGAILVSVPQSSWARISTIPDEISGGNLSSRRGLWKAGLQVFPRRPILGFGAGAFPTAIAGSPLRPRGLRPGVPAHNVLIAIMVEQGVVGLLILLALFGACLRAARSLPPPDRSVWLVTVAVMVIAGLSGNLDRWKVTWLLLGFLAARVGASDSLAAFVMATPSTGGRRYPVPAFAGSSRSAAARLENW